MFTGSVLFLLFLLLYYLWQKLTRTQRPTFGRRKNDIKLNNNTFPRHPPKPDWVKKEVIRLKALMSHEGHRKIAQAFNRLHEHTRNMTIGKTYAGYTIKNNLYEIQVLRRKQKHQRPRPVPHNLI